MATFTYDEVIKGIVHGEDGSIQLKMEDAVTFANILLKYGYAVLFTGGDFGDMVRIEWKYTGDTGNLTYANRENVVFGSPDFVDMLAFNEYTEDEDEDK